MAFTFYTPNHITDAAEIYLWEDLSVTALNGYTETCLFDRDTQSTLDVTIPASTNRVEVEYVPSGDVVASLLMLQNLNFLTYKITINGSLSADVTSVAAENIFLSFDESTITSVRITVYSVSSGDSIMKIGQMIVVNEEYALPKNPDFAAYDPIVAGARLEKNMADGGVATYKKPAKFQARIGLNWVTETVRDTLLDMHNSIGSYTFVPYPTTSAWDGAAYEVNFVGDFNLYKPSRNLRSTPYYAGDINIKETPK